MSDNRSRRIEAAARYHYENARNVGTTKSWEDLSAVSRNAKIGRMRRAFDAADRVGPLVDPPAAAKFNACAFCLLGEHDKCSREMWTSHTPRVVHPCACYFSAWPHPARAGGVVDPPAAVTKEAWLRQELKQAEHRWNAEYDARLRAEAERDALRAGGVVDPQTEQRDELHVGYWGASGYLPLTALPHDAEGQRRFLALVRPVFAISFEQHQGAPSDG